MTTKEQLRRELGTRRGLRHSRRVRVRVGRYIAQQRRAGVAWSDLRCELGIPEITLRRWMRLAESGPRLVQVVTAQTAPDVVSVRAESSGIRVVAPNGWRAEGLTVEQAAAILAASAK